MSQPKVEKGLPKDVLCSRCSGGTKDCLCVSCLQKEHYWLKRFEKAVLKRMAMEPQHSRLDHECDICDAMSDLRHARVRKGAK